MSQPRSYHLEESEIRDHDVVEVNLWVGPCEVEMFELGANGFVWNQSGVHQLTLFVETTGESTAKQIDSHYAEDEPEHEADEQHVEYRWNRLD